MLSAQVFQHVILALAIYSLADAQTEKPADPLKPQVVVNEDVVNFNDLRPPLSSSNVEQVSLGNGEAGSRRYDLIETYRRLRGQPSSRSKSKQRNQLEKGADSLSPVILIPGYGGSRLEGKRDKSNSQHYFCESLSDWSNIWIDLKLMLPYMIDCLIEDFRLEFDSRTNTTHDSPGMEVRVRDPDDVTNVEYLTSIQLTSFGYFAPIIKRLASLGYTRNLNIKGAPYDFRKAPNEMPEFFAKLKRDSEQLFKQFGQRLTYICHSMGCNNILHFLQKQPKQWKDRHVRRVISLAAPWAGSMQAVRATVFGDNLGLPYLFDEAKLRIVQKSVPSTMYLFPKEQAFKNSPLITFKYTRDGKDQSESLKSSDFERFFAKIDHPSGYLMYLNTKDLLGSLEAPQVEVWCLYGTGRPTLGRMEFQGDLPDSHEEDVFDDGDGTVTLQSSSFCRQWSSEQSLPVRPIPLSVGHVDILRDTRVLDTIEAIIMGDRK